MIHILASSFYLFFFYLEKCQFICTSSYQKFLKIHTDCFAVIWNAVFAHVVVFELSNNH